MINRKTLVFGPLILALTAICVILGWGIIRKTQLDTSSQILALETIQTVLKANDRDAMLLLMSDKNFDTQHKDGYATRFFNLKRSVGALQTISRVTGTSNVPLLPFSLPPTASYQFDLNMLAGPITLTSDLVWTKGSWQFSGFKFAGNLLLN
ncbi:MAG: hypothetical protein ACJA2Q_001119 [Pseudohongiellaceae bacterium]|jgi:hypothetical protein